MGFDMGYIDEEMLASWGKESEMNEKLADPANKENFKMVDPRDIQPFRDHTFQVRDDEEMKELRDKAGGHRSQAEGGAGDRNACEPGDRHAADGRIQPANP